MVDGGVALVGAGLVGSLGLEAATACAAARAQVSRAAVQTHYRVRNAVEGLEEPVVGHAVPLLTAGFEHEARLARLAQGALADLFSSLPAGSAFWNQRVGFYLALPDRRRHRSGQALDPSTAASAASADADDTEEAGDDEDSTARPVSRPERLLRAALAGSGWAGWPDKAKAFETGHVGGLRALGAALVDLRAETVDSAVVLAADTLLDQDSLHWLHSRGRLKCGDAPAGLQPGEAAVALALARPGGADGTGVLVEALSLEAEPKAQVLGAVSTGEALARALLAAAGEPGPVTWMLSDHNGEHYRANDLGHALTRLRARHERFAAPVLWYPAASFGDTGCASAPLAVCMAWQAHVRRYAPSSEALVLSCDDGPGRGAVRLRLH